MRPIQFLFLVGGVALFLLACRTADLIVNTQATATPPPATRAAQRPTFTPIPTETAVPPTDVPTDAPPPTDTPEPSSTPRPTARPPTRRPATPIPPSQTLRPPAPTPSPTAYYLWIMSGSQSCVGGSENESSVTGKITANNKAAVGQFVQASSGPGGEPISDVPAQSDSNGNYKVSFVCGGKACNGDFWIWMVDNSRRQLSPFVKFSFNSGCRKGSINFQKR